jgi:serine/threonine-protein kinase
MTGAIHQLSRSGVTDPVLDELLADFVDKWQAGERVDAEAYVRQHPERAEQLREMLPAVEALILADLGRSAVPEEQSAAFGRAGRCQFLAAIAQGGMGEVFKVHDVDLGRELAVKVLPKRYADRPDLVRRFVEEAQITGQLQHPGIVPVHELGWLPDRRPYFTMKLVQGQTLAALLEARSDPAQDRARLLTIFQQVCQTLAYAHARGVIHRDLKPSNIMVGTFGEVQVMDWGLAKVLAEGGGAGEQRAGETTAEQTAVWTVRTEVDGAGSRAGAVMGTYAYMAPEQAWGEVDRLDERCDVFGLGAVLCEILTGQPPYQGRDRAEMYRQAKRGDLTEALARLDGCGAEADLLTLAKACLALARDDRPRDAGVVAAKVAAFLASVQERLRAAELASVAAKVKAEEAQVKAVQERKARRLMVELTATVLAMVLLAGAGGLWIVRQQELRSAAIAQKVAAATRQRDQAKWLEMLSTAQDAQALLGPGKGDADLRQGVQELLADAEMVLKLTDIRTQKGDPYDEGRADAEYAQAFRDYGIDVDRLAIEGAAKRIRARPAVVAVELVTALDGWALERRWRKRTVDDWQRLVEVARAADPNPDALRNRLRDLVGRKDRAAVRNLVASVDVANLPAQSLHLLGKLLNEADDPEGAVEVLERGWHRHPLDALINFNLAWGLHALSQRRPQRPRVKEALRYGAIAAALRPELGGGLARALRDAGKTEEAITLFRKLSRLRPNNPNHYNELGMALRAQGRLDDAIASYRQAIRVQPDFVAPYVNLGNALFLKGRPDEAIAAVREAVRRQPDLARAHRTLGMILHKQGQLDDAIAAYSEAIRLKPDFAAAYNCLGAALGAKGRLDEAVARHREAIRLRPDFADAYNDLGITLRDNGKLDDAIAAYREAIRLKPDFAKAYNNLAIALKDKGQLDEAIAGYREAIRLQPDYALAFCNLGRALQRQGRFADAVAAIKRGQELGSKVPLWSDPSGERVRQAERLVELDAKLPAVLRGEAHPANADEGLELAQFCHTYKRLYGAAASLWEEAFVAKPELAEDLQSGYRYDAACSAALASCGEGEDAASLDPAARARWRRQALDWLRADLVQWTKRLEGGTASRCMETQRTLGHWRNDPDLAGLRDKAQIGQLPKAERVAWRKLWTDVDTLLARARE